MSESQGQIQPWVQSIALLILVGAIVALGVFFFIPPTKLPPSSNGTKSTAGPATYVPSAAPGSGQSDMQANSVVSCCGTSTSLNFPAVADSASPECTTLSRLA